MKSSELRLKFLEKFDVVGIIETKTYLSEARKRYHHVSDISYQTMVVLGLAYPKRDIRHSTSHLVSSFYTFGSDYHQVLKNRIKDVMANLGYSYIMAVDNHPHDERLAAVLAGIGYFGKNQLIINKDFGTYMFLGLVLIDVEIENEFILEISDDCGSCTKCIKACPTGALSEGGYDVSKCISYYNQSKEILTDDQITSNHLLFGCDICQIVCPKNIDKGNKVYKEFELSGKEMVSIVDLFMMSNQVFNKTYSDMSYLWKGKTILMRNALMVMLKQKNKNHLDLIEDSIHRNLAPWYQNTAIRVLDKLKTIK